jgi:hypothetical protein
MSDRRGTDPAEPRALSGRTLGDTFPGLKPRAESSSCPFGVENPLRSLKLMLMRQLPDSGLRQVRATDSL